MQAFTLTDLINMGKKHVINIKILEQRKHPKHKQLLEKTTSEILDEIIHEEWEKLTVSQKQQYDHDMSEYYNACYVKYSTDEEYNELTENM